MKWILSLLLFTSAAAFGQDEDSTKYIWYKYQYGSRLPRMWADSVFHVPFGDTTGRRPAKPGALMVCSCDTLLYVWRDTGWAQISGTGGSGGGIGQVVADYGVINVNDSTLAVDTALISTRAWRQKGLDSSVGLINLKLNISDTAAMLANYLRKVDTAAMLANYVTTPGYGLLKNGKSFRVDTLGANGSVTRSELKDSLNYTTILFKPLILYEGSTWETPDTLDVLRGWGIALDADSALTVDSAALSGYYLRRKDSTTDYVTPHDLTQLPTPTLQQVTDAGQVTNDSIKVRTVSIDSALYMAVRSASDSINLAQKAGLIVYDSVSGSFMYRNQNIWTFLSSLSNSLIPNRPDMRLIAGVIRPTASGSTITWNWIINSSHDSIGFGPITCDGISVNLALTTPASKIHTIIAVPDETLAQYIDVGISFQTTQAKLFIKRRVGVISGYFQGNGTTYVWTGTAGVTNTYNTATGQLNFDYNVDYLPPSNGTAVRYAGANGYTCKRLFSGLSGNDRGYQVTDEFGNGVVGAPTSTDLIEVVLGDQPKPSTINPCSAPGDGWAAYVLGGGFSNIWVIGLIEY